MRRVAAELNQPVTAFPHDGQLRWFTPAVELPLCGHATLATAHVLYEAGLADPAGPVVFETAPGRFARGAGMACSGSGSP
jgi:predicted PhzF superfamily epimerase YddE/YHI9